MGPRCCRLFHLSRPPPSGNISHLRDRIPGLRGLKDWQWRPSRRQTGDEFSATTQTSGIYRTSVYFGKYKNRSGPLPLGTRRINTLRARLPNVRYKSTFLLPTGSDPPCLFRKKTFLLFFTRIYRRAVEKISSIFPIKAIDASPFPQRRRGAACERNALTFPPFFFINTSGVVTSLGWA